MIILKAEPFWYSSWFPAKSRNKKADGRTGGLTYGRLNGRMDWWTDEQSDASKRIISFSLQSINITVFPSWDYNKMLFLLAICDILLGFCCTLHLHSSSNDMLLFWIHCSWWPWVRVCNPGSCQFQWPGGTRENEQIIITFLWKRVYILNQGCILCWIIKTKREEWFYLTWILSPQAISWLTDMFRLCGQTWQFPTNLPDIYNPKERVYLWQMYRLI